MDFLDPKKQRQHMIRLLAGYVLIGIAVLIGTLILLYQAYGFGIAKDGKVIQYGLVFVSSQPRGSDIYLNDTLYKSRTNTKLQLEAGQYKVELKQNGYRNWLRTITVAGGSLQHFDYPLLFPAKLATSQVTTYPVAPGLATQSLDRRWLLVQRDASPLSFDLFDLADPKKVNTDASVVTLPDTLLTSPKQGDHSWKQVSWSNDGVHVLLEHTYSNGVNNAAGSEYIMVDREEPDKSVNLSKDLSLAAGQELGLRDQKYDRFYVFDPAAKTLGTATNAAGGSVTPLLSGVLAYKPYAADTIAYVSDDGAAAGKVWSMLYQDEQSYKIREHTAAPPYLIDLAKYDGDWFLAAGASGDGKVYVFKNPLQIRRASQTAALVPVRILQTANPQYLAFSSNTQFITVANGNSFANYDVKNDEGYSFTAAYPLDPPANHAAWMDGNRLTYISGGNLVVLDYDGINGQTLMPAAAGYLPFFNRNYNAVYSLVPSVNADGTSAGMKLTATSLLTPEDQ